jgi:AraC-like DNA-binding protein
VPRIAPDAGPEIAFDAGMQGSTVADLTRPRVRRNRTLRSRLVPRALAYLNARGSDMPTLGRLGLPRDAPARDEVRLSIASLHAFWETAERASRDRFFGLHFARSFPRGGYGLPELVSRHAPNLHEALARVVQFQTILHDLPSMTLSPYAGGGASLEHEVPGEPDAIGRHGNEFVIALIVRCCREFAGKRVVPRRVWFAHAAPEDVSELVDYFETSAIEFGWGRNGFLLDQATLALPVRGADAAYLPVLDDLARRVAPVPVGDDLLPRVRARVRVELADPALSLEGVAGAVHMSPRTLQRRLRDANTTFAALVDDVRRQTALDLLQATSLGVAEIGERVGYAQPRAFARAFKRWTGTTPRRHRDRESA